MQAAARPDRTSGTMQSDEELAAAACRGQRDAFTELVGRYRVRLFRFLLTRCASPADAEDALQDTFVNAYRYLDSYDPRWRFSTWLYRIGIRAAAKTGTETAISDLEPADPDADPLSACIRASTRENVWLTAKRLLSADAFHALWLRYVEELSIRDVSRALDRSPSWVKVTLMRSRNRLAGALDDESASVQKGESYG